jgi:hypothetical protein
MDALRRFYASVLLDAGESIKAVDRALTGTQATVDGLTTADEQD